jgi:hypothetical protein
MVIQSKNKKGKFITENRSTASYDEIAITGFLM